MAHTCLCLFLIFGAVSAYEAQKTLMTSPYISYYPHPDTSGIPSPWKSSGTWTKYVRALLKVCIRKFLSGIITYLWKTSLCVDRSLNLQNQTEVVKDKVFFILDKATYRNIEPRPYFRYAIHKKGPYGMMSISVKQNQDDALSMTAVNNQTVMSFRQGIGFMYKFNFLPLFDINMTFTLFNLVGLCFKRKTSFEELRIATEYLTAFFCQKRPQWTSFLLSAGQISYFNVERSIFGTSHIVFQFQVMNAKTIRSFLDRSTLVLANEAQTNQHLLQIFTCKQDTNKHIFLYFVKTAKYQHLCLWFHTLYPDLVYQVMVGRKKYQTLEENTKLLVNYFHCFFQVSRRTLEKKPWLGCMIVKLVYTVVNTNIQAKFSLNFSVLHFEATIYDNICVYQFATNSEMFAQIKMISIDLQWSNTQTCFLDGVSFFDSHTFYEVLTLCVNVSHTTDVSDKRFQIHSFPYVAASNLTTFVLHSMEAGNLSVCFTAVAVQCRGVFVKV